MFAAAILGFGSRFNPLRAGLILGALVLFLTAMGFWAAASDKWIGFLMTLINFGVLAGCYVFLEEGLPLSSARAAAPAGAGGHRAAAVIARRRLATTPAGAARDRLRAVGAATAAE